MARGRVQAGLLKSGITRLIVPSIAGGRGRMGLIWYDVLLGPGPPPPPPGLPLLLLSLLYSPQKMMILFNQKKLLFKKVT